MYGRESSKDETWMGRLRTANDSGSILSGTSGWVRCRHLTKRFAPEVADCGLRAAAPSTSDIDDKVAPPAPPPAPTPAPGGAVAGPELGSTVGAVAPCGAPWSDLAAAAVTGAVSREVSGAPGPSDVAAGVGEDIARNGNKTMRGESGENRARVRGRMANARVRAQEECNDVSTGWGCEVWLVLLTPPELESRG